MLETERLILRHWMESDAETLFKYASDPEVGPRAGWAPHASLEHSRELLLNESLFNNDYTFAIELKETSEVIGCIGWLPNGVSNIEIGENECEVGYWIARPYWKKGICTEALRALIDFCFNSRGYTKMWGEYFIDNPVSGRVMRKCGFRRKGSRIFCENLYGGKDRPVQVMLLSRDEQAQHQGILSWLKLDGSSSR